LPNRRWQKCGRRLGLITSNHLKLISNLAFTVAAVGAFLSANPVGGAN